MVVVRLCYTGMRCVLLNKEISKKKINNGDTRKINTVNEEYSE